MNDVLEKYFQFSTFIEKLKKIERFKGQFYWRDYPQLKRYESVADHSWRLAILVILFSDKLSKPFNTEKALKMALVHDLPEVIAGDSHPMGEDGTGKDTYAYRKELKEEKHKKEDQAAKNLFKILPKGKGDELYTLWLEYEKQDCFEAQIVKALDKLESKLQVLEYRQGYVFKNHQVFNLDYGYELTKIDPAIYEFGQILAKEMKKKYKEFNK